jgi:integrase
MTKALTSASVARFRPDKGGVREIPDGACTGLYLQIYQSGRKSWALRYRRPGDGRTAKLVLGSVFDSAADDREPDTKKQEPEIGDHLSLGAAHLLVAKLRNEINQGRDPGIAHIAAKRAIVSSDKFGGAALDFIEQHARRKTRRWKDTSRLLGLTPNADGDGFVLIPKGLADRWRDKPVAEIDGDLIHAVIDEVRERGIPGLQRHRKEPSESRARSMFSALSAMFGWLIKRRRLRQNPCVGVARPETPKSRDRVLADRELVWFWKATSSLSQPFGALLRMISLTGCRRSELAGMNRDELTDDLAMLSLPGERTKNGLPHDIPLPPLAREILKTVEAVPGGSNILVFTTNGVTPVSGFSKIKKRLDELMVAEARKERGADATLPPWRLHDLRRTCATGMAEIGVAPHIVEACLNHISGAKAGVAGVYNRAAYAAEKKAALERWAAHIDGLVAGRPANVTPIRKGK